MDISIKKVEGFHAAQWEVEFKGKKYNFYLVDIDHTPGEPEHYKDMVQLYVKDNEFTSVFMVNKDLALSADSILFACLAGDFEKLKVKTPKPKNH